MINIKGKNANIYFSKVRFKVLERNTLKPQIWGSSNLKNKIDFGDKITFGNAFSFFKLYIMNKNKSKLKVLKFFFFDKKVIKFYKWFFYLKYIDKISS